MNPYSFQRIPYTTMLSMHKKNRVSLRSDFYGRMKLEYEGTQVEIKNVI